VRRTSPPTLKQIAEATGVHPSTVSRALNPRKRHLVADEVVQRISAFAQSLKYQPNRIAASLRTGRSQLIGVLLPNISDPVFPPILGGIAEVLAIEGFSPVIANSDNDPSKQIALVENLLNHRIEGLILANVLRDDSTVDYCVDRRLPVVLVNRLEFRDRVSSVVSNDKRGMQLAVDHLASMGHRIIGHVSGPLDTSTGALRREGFCSAIELHGLQVFTAEAPRFTREDALASAKELLAKTPAMTAVVAANDLLALGTLEAVRELGLRCPDDVSIVGHNDIPLVDLISPALTTVRIAHNEMGRSAARLLVEELRFRTVSTRRIVLEPQLIPRMSTSGVRSGAASPNLKIRSQPA
jgi:LacI family transcriptional regulator